MMGEEEDGMAPKPSTSTSQSLMTSQNTFGDPNDVPDHNLDVNILYPLNSSNPKYFQQEFSAFPEFSENVGCIFSDAADGITRNFAFT
ncbi:hypothetical protein CIPAW_02G112000 [Carya illinoinensis]|uniref:Uncharacterized protein n=1 Tax=Carya illinoinensis TaxID=32201 RepID=A0A8T1RDN3_CARIL|nr:hypothetical protein CIPAW_02G112000 [Carya illinoinensis]